MDMQAQRVHRYGAPDVITWESVPIPRPGAGEVLVRIAAAGVGPWDALVRSGNSALPQPLPLTLGADLAGTVVESTTGYDHLAPGDDVFGITNGRFVGSYAEYAVADADRLARKPPAASFAEAASLPVVSVTAWKMLHAEGGIRAGMHVLVHGASGAVGSLAVQLAHAAGARVTALGAAGDADRLRRLGAAAPGNYDRAFEQHVSDVDLVIDTIGGDIADRSFAVMRRGGILVSSVRPPDPGRAAQAGVRATFFIVDVRTRDLELVAALLERKQLVADVGIVLPLAQARAAHEMLAQSSREHRGKIVLEAGERVGA